SVELVPGVLVRHVPAGPYGGLSKEDLPHHLCTFTAGVLRAEAQHEPGWYDVIHSHYWLAGQVGWLARARLGVPLVHSAHTLAKVKNAGLAQGDTPEPDIRVAGEEQLVAEADRLVASTGEESRQLVELYGADPDRVVTVPPGLDLDTYHPGDRRAARHRLRLPADAAVLLFVGRIQRLKAPDVLLRAAALLLARRPELRGRLACVVVGGSSGGGGDEPARLRDMCQSLGLGDGVRFVPPCPPEELLNYYLAADLTVVPSHNESFGLVALESQACGTPVVAARVGGLSTAVRDGLSGVLVDGHDPADYAAVIDRLLTEPGRRAELAMAGLRHARGFDWQRTAERLLAVYRAARCEVESARLLA
ncbi:MAG TPA: D-inositol-3-phosphate glycosyltransferase, partial [Mycobacteriales bacterium]|nr:D-inositol-3-phosphate glycosyltransferase [Mycobacteriales bacterium]